MRFAIVLREATAFLNLFPRIKAAVFAPPTLFLPECGHPTSAGQVDGRQLGFWQGGTL
jgi:hypothetical protein